MATLLKIDASPRGSRSISRALGTTYAEQWRLRHPLAPVVERDLAGADIPFVGLPWITAAYAAPGAHQGLAPSALAMGDEFISELKNAEEWVITSPMYNFTVPACLKAYIDQIVRVGQTFETRADGSFIGLLTGKKVTVIIASAGDYSPGSSLQAYDHMTGYMKSILSVIGVDDVMFVQAGSTWRVDNGLVDLELYLADVCGQHSLLAPQ